MPIKNIISSLNKEKEVQKKTGRLNNSFDDFDLNSSLKDLNVESITSNLSSTTNSLTTPYKQTPGGIYLKNNINGIEDVFNQQDKDASDIVKSIEGQDTLSFSEYKSGNKVITKNLDGNFMSLTRDIKSNTSQLTTSVTDSIDEVLSPLKYLLLLPATRRVLFNNEKSNLILPPEVSRQEKNVSDDNIESMVFPFINFNKELNKKRSNVDIRDSKDNTIYDRYNINKSNLFNDAIDPNLAYVSNEKQADINNNINSHQKTLENKVETQRIRQMQVDKLAGILEYIKMDYEQNKEYIKDFNAIKLKDKLINILSTPGIKIKGFVLGALSAGAVAIGASLLSLIKFAVSPIIAAFSKVLPFVIGLGKIALRAVPIVTAIIGIFSGVKESILRLMSGDGLSSVVSGFIVGVLDALTFGLIPDKFINNIDNKIKTVMDSFIETLLSIPSMIKDSALSYLNSIKSTFSLFDKIGFGKSDVKIDDTNKQFKNTSKNITTINNTTNSFFDKNTEREILKSLKNKPNGNKNNTIVNTPNTVVNNHSVTVSRSSTRNEEMSYNSKYLGMAH